MARKDQRIRSINGNGHKQNRQPRRQGLRLLLFVFIAVLLSAAVVLTQVAWKSPFNTHTNHGAEAMLNNFVETGKTVTDNQQQPLIDRSHRIEIPDQNRTLAFVHIGKSGGSTISLLLRNGCMSAADGTPCDPPDRWQKVPGQTEETIASKRIQFYLHTPHVNSGKIAEYYKRVTSVVVVARDPLERFVSAFLSQHPRNIDATRIRNLRVRKTAEARGIEPPVWAKRTYSVGGDQETDAVHRAAYTGCYSSPEMFATCADPSPREPVVDKVYKQKIFWNKQGFKDRVISLKCREVCRGIVSGKSKYILHLRFNYEAFLKDLPPETEVLVVRTKYLWQDWIDVNNRLGSKRRVNIPDEHSGGDVVNARGRLPARNNLSPGGRKIICQFLTNEIRIYIDLLNRAVNLSDDDVRAALKGVQVNCPFVMKSLEEKARDNP